MKTKNIIRTLLLATALGMASCDDLLDKSPRDKFLDSPEFWSSENMVESYCNSFYANFAAYGNRGADGEFYFQSLGDDQAYHNFDNWRYTSVPGTASDWKNPWTEIRRANYLIRGMQSSTLPDAMRQRFTAIARLNRAWQYFLLVRAYGDVQWENQVILQPDADSPLVKAERTPRDEVMDSIVADLDYASTNLPEPTDKFTWHRHLALAMLSDICLYEGTYRRYCTQDDNGQQPDENRARQYLQRCIQASEELMNAAYSLTPEYGEIYNSVDLSQNAEVIFARNYEKDLLGHALVDYTTGSEMQRGITRDAIDAFLFRDGLPRATTSLPTSDTPQFVDGQWSISQMLQQRDARLAILVDSILAFKGYSHPREPELAEMTSSTGYTIRKYDTDQMGDESTQAHYRNMIATAYTDAPVFWLAIILLNNAEAHAELGDITQTMMDQTVNRLLDRAMLPHLSLTPQADPANNHGVSSLLWEIRRCRRCELMTDKGYRYWDLVRWHQLDKLDSRQHPAIMQGANLQDVPDCQVPLEGGYAVATSAVRTFLRRYYFYPLPSEQVKLGGSRQNPGWEE